MTTKLTKNDSMTNVLGDFEVLTAAFEAMLTRKGIRLDYFLGWSKKRKLNFGDTLYKQWRDWARTRYPNKWLIAAFFYHEGNIPANIWYDTDKEWLEWLGRNINK